MAKGKISVIISKAMSVDTSEFRGEREVVGFYFRSMSTSTQLDLKYEDHVILFSFFTIFCRLSHL